MRFSKTAPIIVLIFIAVQCIARTATPATPKNERVQQLIQKLGAKRYAERHFAERELQYLAHEAIDQLLEAQFDESSEISLAAQHILSSLTINWTRDDEHPIIRQILKDFDDQSREMKVARAEWLAKLEDGDGFPSVGRIARYEQSERIAKQAVIKLIEHFDSSQVDQREALRKAIEPLSASDRQPVRWLRAFQRDVAENANSTEGKDPRSQLEIWRKLAKEERDLLGTVRTQPKIAAAITHRVAMLALKQNDDAVATEAINELLKIHKDEPNEIIALGRSLIDADHVSIFEKTFWNRFEKLKEDEPMFVYLGAEAFVKSKPELGRKLADQAFEMNAVDEAMDEVSTAFTQINTAIAIENRGLTEWAIREYRRLMNAGGDDEIREPWRLSVLKEQAAVILSELLHDRGRDKEAADVLAVRMKQEPAIDVFGQEDGSKAAEIESRMHFFRSEQHRQESNREEQIKSLLSAVEANPTDADVLIAMYRLPRADEAWKKETKKYITKAVEIFEANLKRLKAAGEISNRADIARDLNQLAWLVGNTEGDQRKAVEYSRRSLELRPHSPGSLDTLGRTYFAIGDLENAIKYQRRAVKLEPHSQQIARQLVQFEEAASQGLRRPTKP